MSRIRRLLRDVNQFHESDDYRQLTQLNQQSQLILAQFANKPEDTLIFLANLHQAYDSFAEKIDDGTYSSNVADDADEIFLQINSLISQVLQFNHSSAFPSFDSDVKMLDQSADYSMRYWHQVDMIESLYNQLYYQFFNHQPSPDDQISKVQTTQKITHKLSD